MSAETLREAAARARQMGTAPLALGADFDDPIHLAAADWLDEVAGWRDEGLGLMPATNLADAWGEMERCATTLARAYLGAPTTPATATASS